MIKCYLSEEPDLFKPFLSEMHMDIKSRFPRHAFNTLLFVQEVNIVLEQQYNAKMLVEGYGPISKYYFEFDDAGFMLFKLRYHNV